jgi:hypothetical protein
MNGSVRSASSADLAWVKPMADRHRYELGFVLRPALADAIGRGELLVVERRGFCHYRTRRDGQHVIYELCSEDHVGHALLDAVPLPRRLKCPADNLYANRFYHLVGGHLASIERGKRRRLFVWEWR